MGVSATPRAKEKWLATVRRLPQIRLEANRNRIEIRSNHIREEYERDEGTTHNTQTRSKRSLSKNNNTLNYRVLTELEDDASINTTTTSLSKFKIRVLESGVIAPELGIVMEQTGSYMEYSGYIYVPIIYHMPHLAESGLVGKGETCNTTANWEHQNLIVQLLKEKIGTLIPQNHKRRSKRFIKAISRRGHQFSGSSATSPTTVSIIIIKKSSHCFIPTTEGMVIKRSSALAVPKHAPTTTTNFGRRSASALKREPAPRTPDPEITGLVDDQPPPGARTSWV
ncbi:unnamed protein product, partial [Brenthis ino]